MDNKSRVYEKENLMLKAKLAVALDELKQKVILLEKTEAHLNGIIFHSDWGRDTAVTKLEKLVGILDEGLNCSYCGLEQAAILSAI